MKRNLTMGATMTKFDMTAFKDRSPLVKEKVAAEYLGVSARWLAMDRFTSGQAGTPPTVPFVRMSRNVRYRISDLEAYIAKCVVGVAS